MYVEGYRRIRRAVNGLLSVATLLEEPRLARLYTFELRNDEVTIDDITDALDLPRTTAYSDTGTLIDLEMESVDPYFEDIQNARDQGPDSES
jgi:hypothetical protein